jgi:hypothetical protein
LTPFGRAAPHARGGGRLRAGHSAASRLDPGKLGRILHA